MKKFLLSFLLLTLAASSYAVSTHNYSCIAETLAAYNSDFYYELTNAEIDELLLSNNDIRANKVRAVAKVCDSKTAKFYEVYQDEAETITIMKTELEVTSQDELNYSLKTTKTTRWTTGSKFIDIKNVTINFFDSQDDAAVVTVIEASASGMGAKTTKLIMDCKKIDESLRCEKKLKDTVLKLAIGE